MPSFPDNATETETAGNETLSQVLTSAGYVFDPCEDSTTCEMGQFDIQINFGLSNSVTQVIHIENNLADGLYEDQRPIEIDFYYYPSFHLNTFYWKQDFKKVSCLEKMLFSKF